MTSVLLRDVEVDGELVHVRWDRGRVVALADSLSPEREDEVVDGEGGALLPGLHDHHLHLLAMASARSSVDCSAGLDGLRLSPGDGWVRGVAAQESLDRHAIDRVVADRPVRVQHRSGGLWMLNSRALEILGAALDDTADVERDDEGQPTGRLWRYDERLRAALPADLPDLTAVVTELHGLGITSVTDATPDLDARAVDALSRVRLDVTLLGDPDGTWPRKLLLRDHDLPTYDQLAGAIADTHAEGRCVAVHCVSRESLLLTLAVLGDVGHVPGDRIEHAAVVPPEARPSMRGLTVVTQPAFVTTRGAAYRTDVDASDLPHLYPYASLLSAGVTTLPSSDAPYGPVDPWLVMTAAASRDLVPDEQVGVDVVLDGYLRGPSGGRRVVRPGATTDLVLLATPLLDAIAQPSADLVRRVFVHKPIGRPAAS